jgi:hypothetical protein
MVEYAAPPRPGGVFVVAGPLSDDSLLRLIHHLGSHVSALESCTSPDRWMPLAAASGEDPRPSDQATLDLHALAVTVLAAGLCPRRSTADRRAHLLRRLEETAPASIIYARQSFCDPGAYDALLVAQLAREQGLPYLEIEVDFPFDANGPLRVRVEAFLEAQLLDEDLLGTTHTPAQRAEQAPVRRGVPAFSHCDDCPSAQAGETRVTPPDDDLTDDLFDDQE